MKICLNMIVRDEATVIERCLRSIRPFIDYWVIFDTGSLDRTKELITTALKDVPGELHNSKWVGFDVNRNEVLNKAKGKGDYHLFIDADEYWKYSADFRLPELTKDFYTMTIKQLGSNTGTRTALIRDALPWKWMDRIHEFPYCAEARTSEHLQNIVNICNEGQGARAKDPLRPIKDAEICVEGLRQEPTNARYAYYAGVSYFVGQRYYEAIQYLEKRLSMTSPDDQEMFNALYYLGLTFMKLGRSDEAISIFQQAHELRPTRAEPLHQLAILYRQKGLIRFGYVIAKHALTLPLPTSEASCHYIIYDHQLLIEFMNCSLLSGYWKEGLEACEKLLRNPELPSNYHTEVVKNRDLARKSLITPVRSVGTERSVC